MMWRRQMRLKPSISHQQHIQFNFSLLGHRGQPKYPSQPLSVTLYIEQAKLAQMQRSPSAWSMVAVGRLFTGLHYFLKTWALSHRPSPIINSTLYRNIMKLHSRMTDVQHESTVSTRVTPARAASLRRKKEGSCFVCKSWLIFLTDLHFVRAWIEETTRCGSGV